MRLPSLSRRGRPRLHDSYDEGRVEAPLVERLPDDELERLNDLLPWRCFTVDARGRAFGGTAWKGKRVTPEPIPDRRIVLFDERFGLADKHVLEIGCFEGVHTIELSRRAGAVTAVDSRVENVVKTVVRCAFFDERPRVLTFDVERDRDWQLLHADLCHHVGVLYHLQDPVTHLRRLGELIGAGLMLDTHFATDEQATEEYTVDGERFRFRPFQEQGRGDVFSGMSPTSRWLLLDDLVRVVREAGFGTVEIVETRDERNGSRVLLFAERAA
jgi:hypothetical protein